MFNFHHAPSLKDTDGCVLAAVTAADEKEREFLA